MSKKPLMDDKELVDTIISKLDKLDERLDSVDITLVRQEANLAEHMRRTELNEIAVEKLGDALAPIKTHVDMIKGAGKLLGVLSIVIGIVAGLLKIFI